MQSVTYSGGEPLIRPDFFEIAEHVARLGLGAPMATNGMLVNQSVATRLHGLGIDVQITLNGATAGGHEAFTRVRESFDRARGAIHVLPLEFEETLDECPALTCPMDTHIGCDGAIGYCTISPTGEVLPCSYLAGVDAVSLRDRPFRWIWDHSRFLAYFRSLVVADLEGACAA